MRTLLLSLLLLGLMASLVAACGAGPTPASLIGEPTATARPEVPTATARPPTPSPLPASPTVSKPTATFVPLITPSPTPTGDQLTQASVLRIGVAEARALADAGEAILVDVRSRATYEQQHIQGALSLPLDQVAQRSAELSGEAQIIFYCAWMAEHQSAGAALIAIENGLTNVAALQGGWAAWQQVGYPVEGSRVTAPTVTAAAWSAAGGVAALGEPDAPVTIVEFSDFQ